MKKPKQRDSDLELLLELLRHPGWKLVENKVLIILENAQKGLNQSNLDTFELRKGSLETAKLFHNIFVLNPRDIINVQGIGVKDARS